MPVAYQSWQTWPQHGYLLPYVSMHSCSETRARRPGAHEWAKWIRQHAERTDPLNGQLRLVEVTSCSHEELQPHMRGWSTYGPYR
jgi:hypothetical protein